MSGWGTRRSARGGWGAPASGWGRAAGDVGGRDDGGRDDGDARSDAHIMLRRCNTDPNEGGIWRVGRCKGCLASDGPGEWGGGAAPPRAALPADPDDLRDAIESNSGRLVGAYLRAGADPNASSPVPLLDEDVGAEAVAAAVIGLRVELRGESGATAADSPPEGHVPVSVRLLSCRGRASPLHLAVVNCAANPASDAALGIVHSLVDAGADPSAAGREIAVALGGGDSAARFISLGGKALAPLGMALILKTRVGGPMTAAAMDRVVDAFLDRRCGAAAAAAAAGGGRIPGGLPPTAPVPRSVIKTWRALLFSEKFSDVRFVCEDGTVLHAHRNILAAASTYFRAAFEGPWKDHQKDGEWRTKNPPQVMRAVLSYIYTGEMDPSVRDGDPLTILAVAHEYNLPALMEVGEAGCRSVLTNGNMREILQLANLYGCNSLKQSCFDHIKANAADVLTDPSVASLASEDEDLWNELRSAISPNKGRATSWGGQKNGNKRVKIDRCACSP